MKEQTTREIGDRGEDIAVEYLKKLGWQILARNYYAGHTEIDIIAKDKNIIVFVEVKTRANTTFGHPIEYVTESKVKSIYKVADVWIRKNNAQNHFMRFDVIGIVAAKNKKPDITHLKDAYR